MFARDEGRGGKIVPCAQFLEPRRAETILDQPRTRATRPQGTRLQEPGTILVGFSPLHQEPGARS